LPSFHALDLARKERVKNAYYKEYIAPSGKKFAEWSPRPTWRLSVIR